MACLQLESELENLKGTGYDKYPISPQTPPVPFGYNCIAFAAGCTDRCWWPHPNKFLYYWPPHLSREAPELETVNNFIKAFEWKGYRVCKDGKFKKGVEKVVIFAKNNHPKHAARQLDSGRWISKCGSLEDIQHETLTAVQGQIYGTAHTFMHRRADGKPFWKDRFASLVKRLKFASPSSRAAAVKS
jgi:hypothetical protein